MTGRVSIPRVNAGPLQLFADSVKTVLDRLTGQNRAAEALEELEPTATTAEQIDAINTIIRRLNGG